MIRSMNSSTKGCSYCSGKKVIRSNSFAILHPELMDEYDPDNEIDPFNVSEFSGRKVQWICRNNREHRWKATFYSRSIGYGLCRTCHIFHYDKMLCECLPELEQFYDQKRNERSFQSYSYKSNERVWWKCRAGHSFPRTIDKVYVAGKLKCPICEFRWLVPGVNSLADTNPLLSKEWSPRNERSSYEYFKKSYDYVFWKCPTCTGEYKARIIDREYGDDSCPYCANRRVLAGYNTLEVTQPYLIKEWSVNNERPITDFFETSSYMALWTCLSCNGEFSARIRDRKPGDDACPYCTNQKILAGYNTVDVTKEELISEWSDKNERNMNEFFETSYYRAIWNCTKCSGEFRARIRDRQGIGDDMCPYCTSKKVLAGYNTVDITKPELVAEWSEQNERPMSDFLESSSYLALWDCLTCKGTYKEQIRNREPNDDSCPYCTNRKVLAGYNTLDVTKPTLATQWSQQNERPITDFFETSCYIALWDCPSCKGTFPERIYNRDENDDVCPYCNGRRVLPGFNSFNVNHPDLMKDWDHINNYLLCNPNEIGDNYNQKVWWFCRNNKEHKYQASPKQRIYFQKRKMEPCTYCKGRRRKKRHFI